MLSLRKTFLAVDYNTVRVRLVQCSLLRCGSVKVVREVNEPVPDHVSVADPSGFGSFLSQLIDREGIGTRSAIFAVSRDAAIVHHLTVPATAQEDLANLVRFRISQELTFPVKQAVVDYVITSRDDAGRATCVLAGAVKVEHIDHLRRLAGSAGLRIKRIGLRPYANFIASREAGYLTEGPALFLELAEDSIEIGIFAPDESLFSRSAGLAIAEEKGLVDNAILQMQRTLPAYEASERYQQPTQVIVAGDTGLEDDLLDPVTKQVNLPAQRFNASGPSAPAVGCTMSACYGLGAAQYRDKNDRFDFLDPKRAVDPAARRRRTIQLATAAVIALLIIGIIGSKQFQSARRAELRDLLSLAKRTKKQARRFDDFAAQVREVNQWRNKNMNWLDEFRQLTDRLPNTKDAYLERVHFTEKAKGDALAAITIEGKAISSEIVGRLFKNLNADGRYEKVASGAQTTRDDSSDYPESFKFTLIIGPGNRGVSGMKETDEKPTASAPGEQGG